MGMTFRYRVCAIWFVVMLWCMSPVAAAEKPNIIVIFTDDQGYADLGAQGILEDLKTPHLDRLAADGVRCTTATSPPRSASLRVRACSPACTSRASVSITTARFRCRWTRR
jgi:hypothetical protein